MPLGPMDYVWWTELKGWPLNANNFDESLFFKFLLSIEDIFLKVEFKTNTKQMTERGFEKGKIIKIEIMAS